MAKDYIPRNDAEFNNWFKFLTQYVAQKSTGTSPEWTHIPPAARTELQTAYAAYYTAYSMTIGPHTPVDTEAKNRTKKAAIVMIRPFVNQYLRYAPVTDGDRTAMGIHNKDTIPTPVPAPASQAEADLVFPGIHLVELLKIRRVGNLSDDPRSDYGVRIYHGILDAAAAKWRITAPPVSGDDLPHSVFTREKKHLFDFDGESGKTVYFCLRYETSRGLAGPFGPMLHAVIP